jgi:hypothetical protein
VLKLKHLRHPLRAAALVRARLAAHRNVRRLASRGERHFRNDPRYNLQRVNDGFASRAFDGADDTALLERICRAYIRASEQESLSRQEYNPTGWWQDVRQGSLGPVRRALATHDTGALGAMYRNFFRDPCSTGLIGLNLNLAKACFGEKIHDLHRHFLLSDALYRIDYWKTKTADRFSVSDLAGPRTGNPFGVPINGTLVSTGAEYQHYCAQRIRGLTASPDALVVEIGGGFGGMAYYLLRDNPEFTYINFDVPESLALTAYYLIKAFPRLKFLLYGEEALTHASLTGSSVILMPPFELPNVPSKSVDVTFSSHTISDLSTSAKIAYLNEIARMTRTSFMNIGNAAGSALLDDIIRTQDAPLGLVEKRASGWNSHRVVNAGEVECLYRTGPMTVTRA